MRSILYWAIAFVVAAALLVFQRVTGPTYPLGVRATVDGHEVTAKLPRSHAGEGDATVSVPKPDPTTTGTIEFRRYPTNEDWTRQPLESDGQNLIGRLPHQPTAGKVAYKISLQGTGAAVTLTPREVILRFRGDVPTAIVIPHVLGMVLAMMLAVRAGLEALLKGRKVFALAVATTVALVVGGLIAGAIMQKAAFGDYWTGIPFGYDLTDNKTLIAVVFWLVALWRTAVNRTARGWVLAAFLLTLAIWLIPHSLLGSQLDYTQAQS